eukprot:scaffold6355_cov119-Cylindrotheca_fusiformis.AAC.8
MPFQSNNYTTDLRELLDDDSDGSGEDLPPAPESLMSNVLPPSLTSATAAAAAAANSSAAEGNDDFCSTPSRPRTAWAVRDNSLSHIPKYYPPMDPNTTTYVASTAPSVVAIRIVECLRERSIAAEYDDESNMAMAMTVDRCHFQIQLWKGKVTPTVDFSKDGVVVECLRKSGDAMSFHHACRAILAAARGESTGRDKRKFHQTNAMEFTRLQRPRTISRSSPSSPIATTATTATTTNAISTLPAVELEQIRELLHKDRLECQALGMERLVNLTTPSICSSALQVSKTVLEDKSWLYQHVCNADVEMSPNEAALGSSSKPSSLLMMIPSRTAESHKNTLCWNELQHASKIRSCALRVFCNALENLAENDIPIPSIWSADAKVLDALGTDLQGVSRPISVVEASSSPALASIHEAALAVRCLKYLCSTKDLQSDDMMLDRLEVARSTGRYAHRVLQDETEQIYSNLTEDIRSC